MLDSFFKLSERGTNVRTEVLAGFTTFLTMAYIIFINPAILERTGMDGGAVLAATCIGAAFGTFAMGLYANYPVAQAPGMGLNAFFTFSVVMTLGHTWQQALGAVFVSGVLFTALSALPVRDWIINSIPRSLKMSISAGIGLFLASVGLQHAGIIVDSPTTLVTLADLRHPMVFLACCGFILMVVLYARKVPGAILIAILVTTITGIATGVSGFHGIFGRPPSLAPTLFALDISSALNLSMVVVIFTFLFVDLFETTGILIGIAHRSGLLDKDGRMPRFGRAMMADSTATIVGSMLGTSTVTSYVESAAGINLGGRTGLTAVTVGFLFLLCLFLAPLAHTVPEYATAPALVFVACLMGRGLMEIDWEDITEAAPALVTVIAVPLSFSIANGIAIGFITYAAVKLLGGRAKEATPAVLVMAVLFILKFAFIGV